MEPIASDDTSLNSKVYHALREAIVSGELKPGTLHSASEFAERLSVSRTPVRESLVKLAEAGMVRFERNRGVRVLDVSPQDIEDIFVLRLLLEVPASRRAAERIGEQDLARLHSALTDLTRETKAGNTGLAHFEADASFHQVLVEVSGNARLARLVNSLRDRMAARGMSTIGHDRTAEDVLGDHVRIFEHVAAGRAHEAATAMRAHLLTTGEILLRQAGSPVSTEQLDWLDFTGV